MKRRTFVGFGIASLAGCGRKEEAPALKVRGAKSAAVILKAASYEQDLTDPVRRAMEMGGLDVKGKHVLVKPNFVEYSAATSINTHPAMVRAAVEVLEAMGAASVRIGEGPGHRRDTWGLAEEAGYMSGIPGFEKRFTDLNRDDVSKVAGFGGLPHFWLPNAVLGADVIVSLAKMKTHHWAGATLSMKNFFGVVPSTLYGWPKNQLHHIGIPTSIVELNKIFHAKSFALIDGITGMEGDGPIKGDPKQAGVIVASRDVMAADATACRVMGIDPMKVEYLTMAAGLEKQMGQIHEEMIEQRGESIKSVATKFRLLERWEKIRLA